MVGALHGPGGEDPQRQRDAEPTADQLLAMAYADGELGAADSALFQARLARDPELGLEVTKHRALEVLARRLAPPEPMDHEWRRLALDPVQRGAVGFGWLAFSAGALGLAGLLLWRFVSDDSIDAIERVLVASLVAGAVALLAAAVRARLRTLPFDPYRNVER